MDCLWGACVHSHRRGGDAIERKPRRSTPLPLLAAVTVADTLLLAFVLVALGSGVSAAVGLVLLVPLVVSATALAWELRPREAAVLDGSAGPADMTESDARG